MYREYCIGCVNYVPLHRISTGDYLCRSCVSKLRKALRRQNIDLAHAEREVIENALEEIQREMESGKKKTKWQHEMNTREWRSTRRKRPKIII